MAGFTNKGKYHLLNIVFVNATEKTNYYVALVTSATAPTADTNTLGQMTEIAAGNGYTTGGYQLTPGATDFDTIAEDDGNDKGLVKIKDVVWTASGGSIPSSGGGARYAILTDDNGTVANREVYAYWNLTADRSVGIGGVFTLQDLELDLTEA